jgi:hypothetical protein
MQTSSYVYNAYVMTGAKLSSARKRGRFRERERELFNEFMVDYATVNLRDFSY